ncbi:MAG TPA: M24 family metallopeptidase [Candidatus Limenecus avicola]|uniref:M24 family metallopeptidase n=1 Tax=Candidatus Limenecus avicola TaxID=2840847 RepID=A0A9D1MZS2_9CLOT|nr:M24 family metallopeptidase [Candidatus Limenecus avicola]
MIDKLREFLKDNNLDCLLVNTTDEFLVEYNELCNCARYCVTGFSGSTGDVLVTKERVYQFADGRYHEQADAEVDHETTDVVKLQLGQTFLSELAARIAPESVVGVVSDKISLNFYKALKSALNKKHCKIKPLDFDPVGLFKELKPSDNGQTVKQIDLSIAGVSADEKFKKLAKKLKNNEAYLDTHLENIAYFTNCRQYKTPFSSTFKAKMLVRKQKAQIYTNEKFDTTIGKHFEILPLKDFSNGLKNANKVIFNPSTINYRDFTLIKSKAQESPKDFIKEAKAIKNSAEIEHFKKNFERTDNVVNKAFMLTQTRKDLTELDLSDSVEKEYLAQGANQLSFKTILAAGANSSIIHYSHPSNKVKIKDGDFVLLDCGGHFEGGYSTDITRTFIKGKATALQKKVYTTVMKMFLNAYHHRVTPRTTGFTLDKIARKIHAQSGLKDFNFNHGLGHGVGINVHENPPTISCGPSGKRILKENMVFTIEPGLYKAGFGGVRLENTVYLTKVNGKLKIQSFSHVPFQEEAIDYSILNEQEKKWLKDWQAGK